MPRITTRDWQKKTRKYMRETITMAQKRYRRCMTGDLSTDKRVSGRYARGVQKIIGDVTAEQEKALLDLFLEFHAECTMTNAEVNLMTKSWNKFIPDIQQIEMTQKSEVKHTVEVPMRPSSAEDWAEKVAELQDEKVVAIK